jgi:hypothetical protein
MKLFQFFVIIGMVFSGLTGNCINVQGKIVMDSQKIQVLKSNNKVYVRSYFAPGKDVVTSIGIGRNGHINFERAGLMDSKLEMTVDKCRRAATFHYCGDDATPWNLNGTYIGANHGAYDVLELTVAKHGLSKIDLGTGWKDGKGKEFFLIKIVGPDKIWVLSENSGKGDIWRFNKRLFGKELKNANGLKLKVSQKRRAQLIPSCRIQKQAYLVDGVNPLPDNKAVICDFLDVVDVYDIIAPDSVLEKVKKNCGKQVRFNTGELDSVLTNNIRYRFQGRGACTVLHKAKLNRKIRLGYMGFIQTSQLKKGKYQKHHYFIPKTKAFEYKGVKYDFSGFQDYSKRLKDSLSFNEKLKCLVDPDDLPDRWIQLLGNKEKENDKIKYEIGYAVGYSLTDGITRPELRAKNSSRACFLYTSNKTYPSAVDYKIGSLKAGDEFTCLAYRQYFSPFGISAKSSSSYLHKQGDSWMLYLHYQQPVAEDVVKLPGKLTGKRITVVENTPGVKVLSGLSIPQEGLRLISEKKRGFIVLKID